jgi:hypothetical protein
VRENGWLARPAKGYEEALVAGEPERRAARASSTPRSPVPLSAQLSVWENGWLARPAKGYEEALVASEPARRRQVRASSARSCAPQTGLAAFKA